MSAPGDLADALIAARRGRRPIPVPSPGPADTDEAFRVQDLVARNLGPPAAWKVGGPLGSAPCTAAPIAIPLVRTSPAAWSAHDFSRVGIEAEIAFRIGRDLPPGAGAPTEDAVREAVASIHAAIEIVDTRYDTWPVPDPLAALADNQNNGGLVVQPSGHRWDGGALDRMPVVITVDGATVFDREGVNPGGDPFALLVLLAAHACRHGGGLRTGDYVTTGSLNGIHFVEPGAAVVATVVGIGTVELTLPA